MRVRSFEPRHRGAACPVATVTAIATLTFALGSLICLEFTTCIDTFAWLAIFLGKSANPNTKSFVKLTKCTW